MECERRNMHRYAVPPERQAALLRLSKTDLPARVFDQSAGGFGVRLDTPAPLEPGQALLLGTDTGWYKVRVTNVREWEEGMLLGLERLADLQAPLETPGLLAQIFRCSHQQILVKSRDAIILGLFLVSLCLAGWLAHLSPELFVAAVSRIRAAEEHEADKRQAESPGRPTSSPASQQEPTSEDVGPVTQLLRPEVADSLELDDGQQEQLREILVETPQATAGHVGEEDAADLPAETLKQRELRALGVLTSEQRTKWRQLITGWRRNE
jgi:hypothetical protein